MSKLFCYAPWTNIGIRPTGRMSPCCKFSGDPYYSQFTDQNNNVTTHSIQDYKNSEYLKDIREHFLRGEWPEGCKRCRLEEENGIKSKRILDYERWHDIYDQYDLDSGETITANAVFGTTCNLRCIMCNPTVSSQWRKEWNDIYGTDYQEFKFHNMNFVEDFVTSAPNLVHMDTTGGEPFVSGVDEQHAILDHYIETGRAKDITLHYTTNATMLPEDKWWDRWQHFKEVEIQLSLDGVGPVFEFQRYPAIWNEVVDNVKHYIELEQQIASVRLAVSYTLSAYNVYYLDDFLTWADEIGLPEPWIGPVHRPEYLRPGVWRSDIKAGILNHMYGSYNPTVIKWADYIANNTDDEQYFDKFLEFTKTHCTYRQIDIQTVFPELFSVL